MKKQFEIKILLPAIFVAIFLIVIVITNLGNSAGDVGKKVLEIPASAKSFGQGTEDTIISSDKGFDSGVYEYNSFILKNAVLRSTGKAGLSSITIKAQKRIEIDENSVIDFSGAGYPGRLVSDLETNSEAKSYDYAGGGGVGSGNAGGSGQCGLNNSSQSKKNDLEVAFGGAGGVGYKISGSSGAGGGFVFLIAPEVVVDGKILANGGNGNSSGGGGGGGKIIILADKIVINGTVSATGGAGGSSQIQGAGGGGGGIVMLSKTVNKINNILVSGGLGGSAFDIYTGCQGQQGHPGEIIWLESV